jgi:hypothetical protein
MIATRPEGVDQVSEQWGQPPQDQPEQGPTQPQFPQYPQQQQYPAAPPLETGYGSGYPGGGYDAPGEPYGPRRNSKLAIASLILGIISLPLIVVGFFGSFVALVGLILGVVGIAGATRKNLKRGIGIAGIVLSLLGLIGGGLVTTAALHAANTCKPLKGDNTAYTNCVKHNLKL